MKKFFKILFGTVLIFALFINSLIAYLTLCWNNTQYLYELPGSVWYSEEANMKATVYDEYGKPPYMLIVDLDDGREYKAFLYDHDDAVFYKGNPDVDNLLDYEKDRCKCEGTILSENIIFLKVRSFEIDVADGCPHFPCDAEFRRDNINF